MNRSCICSIVLVIVAIATCSAISQGTEHRAANKQKTPEAAILRLRNSNPIQRIYIKGVPHTDRNGRRLDAYDAKKSFLPIGIYHVAPTDECDGKPLQEAGFNTFWPWRGYGIDLGLKYAKKYGLQAVVDADVLPTTVLLQYKDHPNLLAVCWFDEPTGKPNQDKLFTEFQDYKRRAAEIAPGLPIFVNDNPGFQPPMTLWWAKWNTAGDVSQHDNYPISVAANGGVTHTISSVAETVSLATALNHERKPIWFVVGAFAWDFPPDFAFPFRYPTPEQLRAQVYAALIHGATGIQYFCLDGPVARDGLCLGVSPDPKVAFKTASGRMPRMTPMQMVKSKALWGAITHINGELRTLTPAILSPTVAQKALSYNVVVKGRAISSSPIRTLLKPHPEGGYVMLTVNLDDMPLKVTYSFANPLQEARVLFENRQDAEKLVDDNKSVSLWYEPFDVHVLVIKPTTVPIVPK